MLPVVHSSENSGKFSEHPQSVALWGIASSVCNRCLERLFDNLVAHESYIEVPSRIEHGSRGFKIIFGYFKPVECSIVQTFSPLNLIIASLRGFIQSSVDASDEA